MISSNHNKKSLPFSYKGYSLPIYTRSRTKSQYITNYNGIKLAIDLTFPISKEGKIPEKFPVILLASRTSRRDINDLEIKMGYDLVPYGYVFVVVELSGCGVSYGINDSFGSMEHCQDLIYVSEWVAAQKWCSGKIGMLGCSNRSYIQLCASALNPKKLTALTPVVAVSDFYYQNYPNGVSAVPNIKIAQPDNMLTKEEFLETAVPVDEDIDGTMAYEAYTTCHFGNNKNFFETLFLENMNRDSEHPGYNNQKTNMILPPYGKLDSFFHDFPIKQHQYIGQLESGTLGQLAHYIDFGGTVCLGPWTHFGSLIGASDFPNGTVSMLESYCRWYDYVLKGLDNGFDKAPPITYYMFNAEDGKEWRFSENWPPENEVRTKLYLSAVASDTVASVNDGTLSLNQPWDASSTYYHVRDDIVVFKDENGISRYDRSELYWDGNMEEDVDRKGLTFTSAPLFPFYLNEMAGCVSVDLWISCTSNDIDLVVYLEEVFPDGTSHYIKDGVMRASHRTSGPNAAWEKMGATWHTSMESDVEKCLKEGLSQPTHIRFAIDPIAYHFSPKSRIRFTITCSNKATYQHNMYKDNLPKLTLHTGGEYASYISIPFLEQSDQTYKGMAILDGEAFAGTLYAFQENSYLYTNGSWHKFKNSGAYTTRGNDVILGNENIIFRPMGSPVNIAGMPDDNIDTDSSHPFPAFRKQLVATEKVASRDYTLFVPGYKNLYLDIFKQHTTKSVPCIIYIHGYGSPYAYLPSQMLMMYQKGYAIAAIDIRNYPPNEFPDYINDAKGAIRYLRANADLFGIDPDRFGMYGFSLGGNTTLMTAMTGDLPTLEGTVGGNIGYSSRIQAAAAGFAWSDLLYMGEDIAEEFKYSPTLQADRILMADSEYAPSAEVIGFGGPGRGLKVLREYKQNGCKPSNEFFNQKLKAADIASPVNYATPSAPPIALFGGHGMETINIAFKQSLRTFEALNKVGALTFLYGNTTGEYGEKPETLKAMEAFFDEQLMSETNKHVLAISADSNIMVSDYVSRKAQQKTSLDNDGFWILESDLDPFLTHISAPRYEMKNGYINLFSLTGDNLASKYYEEHCTIVFKTNNN